MGPHRLRACDRARRASVLLVTLLLGAGIALSVTARSTRAGAATTVQVPASIDATGRTDVTDALNAFLARVPSGSTIAFRGGGRYRAEGIVRLVQAQDVTLEGHGARLFATTDGHGATPPGAGFGAHWPRRREHLQLRGGAHVTIHQLEVRGANPHAGAGAAAFVPALEGQAGIAVYGTTGVVLDDVSVSDTYGDFVYLAAGATNVTVRGSHFTGSGRQGVGIVGADHVDIGHDDFTGVARSVIDLEPPGRAVVQDVHVHDNRIDQYRDFLLASGGGGPGVNGIWLQNNRVQGGHGISISAGVNRRARRDYHIIGNVGVTRARPVAIPGQHGLIQLTNLDGVEIRDNRQPVDGVDAVSLDRVCNLTMRGNTFTGARSERAVVAPCGAAAAPAPRRATASTTVPDTKAASAPTGGSGSGGSSGSGGTVALVAAAVLGVVAVAGGGYWLGRRRSRPVDSG